MFDVDLYGVSNLRYILPCIINRNRKQRILSGKLLKWESALKTSTIATTTFAVSGIAGSASVLAAYPLQACCVGGVIANSYNPAKVIEEISRISVAGHANIAAKLAINSFWSRSLFVGSLLYCDRNDLSPAWAVAISSLQAPLTFGSKMYQIYSPKTVNPYSWQIIRHAYPWWMGHIIFGNALFIGGFSAIKKDNQNDSEWRLAAFTALAQFYMAPAEAFVTRTILKKTEPIKLSLSLCFSRMLWKVPEFMLHWHLTKVLLVRMHNSFPEIYGGDRSPSP